MEDGRTGRESDGLRRQEGIILFGKRRRGLRERMGRKGERRLTNHDRFVVIRTTQAGKMSVHVMSSLFANNFNI